MPDEPPDEPSPEAPEALLARALESLDSAQRQRVTVWLLSRTTQPGWAGSRERRRTAVAVSPELSFREIHSRSGAFSLGEGHHVVPVRLPAELHARLRDWSGRHGFSMATVVRGLVGRFLDGQAPTTDE